MMKNSDFPPASRRARLFFAILLPAANILYLVSNRLMAGREDFFVWKATIDDYIPFVAAAIIPYAWWYIQIIFSLVWFIMTRKSTDVLYRYVSSIALVTMISTAFFIVMPTHVPRPQVTGDDWFSALVRFLYSIDEPFNCFPSLHVAYAMIAAWYWHKAGPQRVWFRILNWTSLVLISLATVLTKQHYYPDIPGGLVVALASIAIVETVYKRMLKARCV